MKINGDNKLSRKDDQIPEIRRSQRITRAHRTYDGQIKRKESKIRGERPLSKDWRLSEDKLHFFSG